MSGDDPKRPSQPPERLSDLTTDEYRRSDAKIETPQSIKAISMKTPPSMATPFASTTKIGYDTGPIEKLQAVSMKTPEPVPAPPDTQHTPMLARPKLSSDATPVKAQNLGNLAPPYNPKAAQARTLQEYVIWGCLAVILACAVALIVWFAAM